MADTVRTVAKIEVTRWIIAVVFAVVLVLAQRAASSPDFRENLLRPFRAIRLPHRRGPIDVPERLQQVWGERLADEAEAHLRGAADA